MRAKYFQIYKYYLEKIRQGKYQAGDKLPTEKEIAEKFSVSRDTTRKALALLQQEGVIARNQGSGSTVINRKFYNFNITTNYSFNEWSKLAGFEGTTEVVVMDFLQADEEIKKLFNREDDFEVCYLKRYRSIDGERAFIDINYILAECVEGITKEDAEKSLYNYIENIKGYDIAYVDREIYAEVPTESERQEWNLNVNECFLVTAGQSFLKNGTMFSYAICKHRNKYKFKEVSQRSKLL